MAETRAFLRPPIHPHPRPDADAHAEAGDVCGAASVASCPMRVNEQETYGIKLPALRIPPAKQ
jgi:hypothetical protein